MGKRGSALSPLLPVLLASSLYSFGASGLSGQIDRGVPSTKFATAFFEFGSWNLTNPTV
jgi:hypothetical protein